MIDKRDWKEFRETCLLWWINMILHTFGWAIVYEFDEEGNIISVYPARVKFRGFDEATNTEGYEKISKYMIDNASNLYEESKE